MVFTLAGTASATGATNKGTWYLRPDQTFTSASVVTHRFAYQTAVRSPINPDKSSNWPAKRGVIPVRFDLLVAPNTTTSTTKTYATPVWQSLESGWPYTFVQLCLVKDLYGPGWCPDAPASPALTFNDITNLSADYLFTFGDCHTGSLRWDVNVMHNGVERTVEIYYGNPNDPDQSCSGANSESGQNLISSPTAPPNRFEMLGGWGIPGPLYTTYADAVASTNDGTDKVVSVHAYRQRGRR